MSKGGLSTTRLRRMGDVMAGYVERGEIPGLVTLVSRRGEIHVETIGTTAVGGSEPMRCDTIFRIASMTKPILAAAAMMLVEECKLRLDDPIDRFLPELADRKVLKQLSAPLNDTVPAKRSITTRDLLTCRMGYGCIFGQDIPPIQQADTDLEIMTLGPQMTPLSGEEWLKRFATLPLMHQPGEKWMYNSSFWVLSLLLGRASGQPVEAFLRERIFDPLGMKDTSFYLPLEKMDRLTQFYEANPETGELTLQNDLDRWTNPTHFPDEVVSTVEDYLSFGQMMLNKGKYGNERILSRSSVEAMITDQILPEQKAISDFFPGFWESRGWGFGVSMVTRRDDVSASPGRFGWDGGFGTSWYADPTEDLTAILLTQVMGCWYSFADFWTSVYQSIDD